MTAYLKILFRSVKDSFSRFIAIMAIIALGVGFYSGLAVTTPSFLETGDKFLRDYKLYDFRLLSTIGFTEEDIEAISRLEGVVATEGAVSADAITFFEQGQEGHQEEALHVARFHTMTEGVNELSIEFGRLPQNDNEVVVDGYMFDESIIGSKLVISADNREQDLEVFACREFTVVGTVYSPYYMNFQRGTTDVGGGSLGFYVYVLEDALDFEYFTEAYIYCAREEYIYSDEYDAFMESQADAYEEQILPILELRLDDTILEAREELDDALIEMEDARSEAAQELSDGQAELEDARLEIRDGQEQIDDGYEELADARNELADIGAQLDEAETRLEAGRAELDSEYASFVEQRETAILEIEANRQILDNNLNELATAEAELLASQTALIEGLQAQRQALSDLRAARQQAEENGAPLDQLTELDGQINTLRTEIYYNEQALQQINDNLANIPVNRQVLEESYARLDDGYAEIENAATLFEQMYAELEANELALAEGRAQYEDGLSQIAEAEAELNEAEAELDEGRAEFWDGLLELVEGQSTFASEMAQASQTIDYAIRSLQNIDRPELYVLGRDTNVGYVSLENDAQIVAGVAAVFPLFFFAIAALVCSTTMQRMVADERTQIGTMRAMGYTSFAIVMKYILYAGIATTTGSIIGFVVGVKIFPTIIWDVYSMMYGFAPVTVLDMPEVFVLSTSVALICALGVTLLSCLGILREMPAELVRPKAPIAGKRILLERITFLWTKLSFLHKVSARNVFRFKKRMFMMLIGIAGCTALVLTAFGIKDSISDVVGTQYDKILTYDIQFVFDDDATKEEIEQTLEEATEETGTAITYAYAQQENVTHNGEDIIRDISLIVSNDENILQFIHPYMRDSGDITEFEWPGDGQIGISKKLADKNDLSVGDTIVIGYGDQGKSVEVEIGYIFDNYIFHYAVMNSATYERLFGEEYTPTTVLVQTSSEESAYDFASTVSRIGSLKSWSATSESRRSFQETMNQLNLVVYLVIGCAALLAFIVLFNLNNINITERVREIATLKVLGFNRRETASYVMRENIILVCMGFIVGIPLGLALHRFVIAKIEMDMVTFDVQIFAQSYIFALGMVLLFSLVVDFFMRGKIDRIHMAEALKSIE